MARFISNNNLNNNIDKNIDKKIIKEAKWGHENIWQDVTQLVLKLINKKFKTNNINLECDPCPGWKKQLHITLENGKQIIFSEDEICDLTSISIPEKPICFNNKIDLSKCQEELKKQNLIMYHEFFIKNYLGVFPEHVEGRRIIDIGANYGFFGLQSKSLGSKSVLAIEPDSHNFSILVKNSVNRDIIPIQCAVMQSGIDKIKLIDSNGTTKTIADVNGEIESRTLHEIISCMPSYDNDMVLKIDVGGAEYDILLDASGQDLRRFKYIFLDTYQTPHLESRQGRTAMFLEEYLHVLGFIIEKKSDIFNIKKETNTYEPIENQHSWLLKRT